ncbi:hypothetical protein ACFFVB_15790 [Formosa undariae]|uniref:Uncharacterized protein n=1 Tax=Formosa undariae TaxID=1325436 RepID=A0ABV5F549_9FLAO
MQRLRAEKLIHGDTFQRPAIDDSIHLQKVTMIIKSINALRKMHT